MTQTQAHPTTDHQITEADPLCVYAPGTCDTLRSRARNIWAASPARVGVTIAAWEARGQGGSGRHKRLTHRLCVGGRRDRNRASRRFQRRARR